MQKPGREIPTITRMWHGVEMEMTTHWRNRDFSPACMGTGLCWLSAWPQKRIFPQGLLGRSSPTVPWCELIQSWPGDQPCPSGLGPTEVWADPWLVVQAAKFVAICYTVQLTDTNDLGKEVSLMSSFLTPVPPLLSSPHSVLSSLLS